MWWEVLAAWTLTPPRTKISRALTEVRKQRMLIWRMGAGPEQPTVMVGEAAQPLHKETHRPSNSGSSAHPDFRRP